MLNLLIAFLPVSVFLTLRKIWLLLLLLSLYFIATTITIITIIIMQIIFAKSRLFVILFRAVIIISVCMFVLKWLKSRCMGSAMITYTSGYRWAVNVRHLMWCRWRRLCVWCTRVNMLMLLWWRVNLLIDLVNTNAWNKLTLPTWNGVHCLTAHMIRNLHF